MQRGTDRHTGGEELPIMTPGCGTRPQGKCQDGKGLGSTPGVGCEARRPPREEASRRLWSPWPPALADTDPQVSQGHSTLKEAPCKSGRCVEGPSFPLGTANALSPQPHTPRGTNPTDWHPQRLAPRHIENEQGPPRQYTTHSPGLDGNPEVLTRRSSP